MMDIQHDAEGATLRRLLSSLVMEGLGTVNFIAEDENSREHAAGGRHVVVVLCPSQLHGKDCVAMPTSLHASLAFRMPSSTIALSAMVVDARSSGHVLRNHGGLLRALGQAVSNDTAIKVTGAPPSQSLDPEDIILPVYVHGPNHAWRTISAPSDLFESIYRSGWFNTGMETISSIG
jgi:hypothetical protein